MISWHDVHGHAPMKSLSTYIRPTCAARALCRSCRCCSGLLEDSTTCCWCAATPATFHAYMTHNSSCRAVLGVLLISNSSLITSACCGTLTQIRNVIEVCQPPCSPCSRHPRVVRSSMRRPRCRRVGGRLVLVLVSICRCAGALLQHMCHSHTTDRPVRARVIGYSVFLRAWTSRSTRCSWVLLTGR